MLNFVFVVWAPLQTVLVSFLPEISRAGRDHSVSQQWIMRMNDRSSEILQILPPPACHTLHSGPDTSLLYVYQSLMKCWQVSAHNGYYVPLIVFNEPWALTMAGPYCRWQLRGPSAAPRWEKILCIMNICNPPILPPRSSYLSCWWEWERDSPLQYGQWCLVRMEPMLLWILRILVMWCWDE